MLVRNTTGRCHHIPHSAYRLSACLAAGNSGVCCRAVIVQFNRPRVMQCRGFCKLFFGRKHVSLSQPEPRPEHPYKEWIEENARRFAEDPRERQRSIRIIVFLPRTTRNPRFDISQMRLFIWKLPYFCPLTSALKYALLLFLEHHPGL